MSNFAQLIDRAIASDIRSRLIRFLSRYQVLDLGKRRKLTLAESTLVLNCVDQFLMTGSFTDLGIAEIRSLRRRLKHIAHGDRSYLNNETIVRNACFDAMACNAALEARLLVLSAQARLGRAGEQCAVNDNLAT